MSMPTPDLSFVIPKKYKALAGLIGTGLSFLVPYVLQASTTWPLWATALVGVVLWIATALGIYHAPYAPQGTVLVPESVIAHDGTEVVLPPPARPEPPSTGGYKNPWK